MEKYHLINNSKNHQYEFDIDGLIAKVAYKTEAGKIYLLHTEVPEKLEGEGVGSELVNQVLADIKHKNMKLVPQCAFVAAYIKRHPEWEELIA